MSMRLRGVPSITPGGAADRFFDGPISLIDLRSNRERRTIRIPRAAP